MIRIDGARGGATACWLLGATLLLQVSVAGQVAVGDRAPEVEAEALLNSPYGGMGAFQGKLVLYFWFLPSASASRGVVRSLNPLHARNRSEGFEVVGISHHELDVIKGFVRRNRPKFTIAWEPSNISMGSYPFTQWPAAALVSPRGKVLFKGSPGQVSQALITKNLRGARGRGPDGPLRLALDLPRRLAAVQKAVELGRLGKAMGLLDAILEKPGSDESLQEEARSARGHLRNYLKDKLLQGKEALDAGRPYEARLRYERILRHAKETKQAGTARAALESLRKDPALQRELRGGKKLYQAEIAAGLGEFKRAARLIKPLLGPAWEGTAAQEHARKLQRRLPRR